MPGPSNTLLIEGSFTELAEELAQYIDNLSKAEGNGIRAEIEQFLNRIRESEASQEGVDESALQNQKNEVLKKIVTKAQVLNGAPERGKDANVHCLWTRTDTVVQNSQQHTTS